MGIVASGTRGDLLPHVVIVQKTVIVQYACLAVALVAHRVFKNTFHGIVGGRVVAFQQVLVI